MKTEEERPQEPLRWFSPLFFVYYLVGVWFFPMIFRTAVSLTDRVVKEGQFLHTEPGWIFGREVDTADDQWSTFRKGADKLFGGLLLFIAISQFVKMVTRNSIPARLLTYAVLGTGWLLVLHGSSYLVIVAIMFLTYAVAMIFRGHWLNPALSWIICAITLYVNEHYNNYKFSWFSSHLAFMDTFYGLMRHVVLNLMVLRLISFNMDYFWACKAERSPRPILNGTDKEKHQKHLDVCKVCPTGTLCYEERVRTPLPVASYRFLAFVGYIMYPPLWIAGPIIPFNAWLSQVQAPQRAYSWTYVAIYGARVGFCGLLLELFTHYMYLWAINRRKTLWQSFSVQEIAVLGFLSLFFIWLKFLIIWRSFRFVAFLDGIETVENMSRCMMNNYTIGGFWKAWHRSYNRWLVRYVYVPLGGGKWKLLNMWVVFMFVALWHDMTMQLLWWSWLICLFFMPELLITSFFASRQMAWLRQMWIYRYICAFGGSINIIFLIVANLVGFSVGVDGVTKFVDMLIQPEGLKVVAASIAIFWIGVQWMFEIRTTEARLGYKNDM